MTKDKIPVKVNIFKSLKPKKKFTATFLNKEGKIIKTTHFGARGYSDYTIHKDNARKERYIARHKKREKWDDMFSAGALSRWILWNNKNLKSSIKDYKKKFSLL